MLIGALLKCADIMIWGCKSPEGQSQNTGSTSEEPKRTDRLRSQQQPRRLQGPGKRAACGQGFQQPQPAGPPPWTSKSSRDVPKRGSHTSRTREVQHRPGAGAAPRCPASHRRAVPFARGHNLLLLCRTSFFFPCWLGRESDPDPAQKPHSTW